MPSRPPKKPKITLALKKPIKSALPDGAIVTKVGPKRQDGTHTVNYRTKAGKVDRKAQVVPEGHRPGRLPTEVMAEIGNSIPRGAKIGNVSKIGNKYRVIATVNGKPKQIFVWVKRPQNFKINPVNTVREIGITRAKPGARGRTVTRTVVNDGKPTTRLGGPFRKKNTT